MGGDCGAIVVASEICPTEDTVSALLELLVEPLFPSESSLAKDKAPSPDEEESVAKQVQAVVLLYNYYHRKCNQELEFLDLVAFCKLAVVLKPGLLPYIKSTEEDDNNELSLTDKMIMEACDISKSLDTSMVVEEWPIAKVAVFLVDSSKECCFLLNGSNTRGVWSLIEKEHSLNPQPEGTVEEKVGNRKKKITKKPLKENRNGDENSFQQLAYAAVKDACGCNQKDLKILESHTVYSLSKAKTAVRFYIMQCKKTTDEDKYVPIRDVLDSLQGPLVTKELCDWSTTSVVEYFHLLPYADILIDWLSREANLETSHEPGIEQENEDQPPTDSKCEDNERDQKVLAITYEVSVPSEMPQKEDVEAGKCNTATKENTSKKNDAGQKNHVSKKETAENTSVHNGQGLAVKNQSKEVPSKTLRSGLKLENRKVADRGEEPVVYTKRRNPLKRDRECDSSSRKLSKPGAACSKQKDVEISVSGLSNNMEVDEPVSSADCSMDSKNRNSSGEDCNNNMKIVVSQISPPSLTHVVTKREIVSALQSNHERNGENNTTKLKAVSSCQDGMLGNALVQSHSNPPEHDKVHKAISSRKNLLTEAALKAIHRKRDMLSHQLRSVGDEIALCDRNIQAILDGSEDDLGVTLDSVIEGCNLANSSSGVSAHERMCQPFSQDQSARKCLKSKRLAEAKLSLKSPCQELDDICYENCWVLPTYSISTSDGGLQAAVTVKGLDFECSSTGGRCRTPCRARESAASSMLNKLRKMASEP